MSALLKLTIPFNNALNIQNIISRVTGGSVSNIDGLIKANGIANVFLLNSNGIIFGPNASLNIGGSFLASTASSLNFADGTNFSATANPTTPLLTISVPIGLQFQGTAGVIRNQSRSTNNSGLRVESGKTLALVGGKVHLDGGSLTALDGRIELGGLAGSGTVGLFVDGNDLRLVFPDGMTRADVHLDNNATVDVRGAKGGGSIAIIAQNLNVARKSRLRAGIAQGGSADSFSGDIEINATGLVNLTDKDSLIANWVAEGAEGTGGNINITTESLSLENGAAVSTTTNGKGNAGSVNITARDRVSFDGMGSGAFSNVNNEATGNSGGINITTGALSVTNGATLYANTRKRGNGNPGSVNIRAGSTVSFDGSSAFSSVESGASGNSGDINITTGELIMKNDAQLNASNSGKGNAGTVNIDALSTVSFNGIGSYKMLSGAFSNVASKATGNSGGINITTGSLSVTNGAQLNASNSGQGNAGSVNINARDIVSFVSSGAFSQVADKNAIGNSGGINIMTGSLAVRNGAQLSVGTFGQGNAGSVNIDARSTVTFDGGYARSSVQENAVGNSGGINITTGSLSVTNGAALNTDTNGKGNAGSVIIDAAREVSFDGGYARSTVQKNAVGNSGDINIKTGSLSVTNGAALDTDTNGKGNAGSVIIDTRSTVSFDEWNRSNGFSSGVFSRVNDDAEGKGGDINIKTSSLSVTNGAQLNASTRGQGAGGNITLQAKTLEAVNGGQVLTTSRGSYKAGNITLNVRDITLSGSDRTYDTRSALGTVVVSGAGSASGLYANTTKNSIGQGGDLTITTGQIYVRDGAQVNVSSEGLGNAGNLKIVSRNLLLSNRGTLRAATVSGKGGNIDLHSGDLIRILRNSLISAQADNNGNGGNITINSPLVVALPEEDSDIVANAVQGRGGKINITAQGIYGLEYHRQLTPLSDINASSDFGVNGIVQINTLGIDQSFGLVKLPTELLEASGLIATSCAAVGANRFIVTGRGGLPPNPSDTLSSDTVWTDLRPNTQLAGNLTSSKEAAQETNSTPEQLVEAQGWVINDKGEVVLTAHAPNVTPNIPWITPANCHSSISHGSVIKIVARFKNRQFRVTKQVKASHQIR